jgi:hypothetical protein
VSRLLVELNRSPGRQFRESPVMRFAPAALHAVICRRYYDPYWSAVVAFVCAAIAARGRVVHISSHSFAPRLGGAARRTQACRLSLKYASVRDHASFAAASS